MRCSVFLVCIALTPGVAFNPNNQARLRMQQGFGKQSQSKTPAKLKTPAKAPPPAVPKQTPVRAGELPEDAFSQFPPLTPEQKQTLQKARGGKATDFPVEVRMQPLRCWRYIVIQLRPPRVLRARQFSLCFGWFYG